MSKSWLELGVLGVAMASGNAGLMMISGFLPGPPGMEYALGMGLVMLSAQCLVLLVQGDALFRRGKEAPIAEE